MTNETAVEATMGCDIKDTRGLCTGEIHAEKCPTCGKWYRRCDAHGGASGARRSLGSHKGLIHYVPVSR